MDAVSTLQRLRDLEWVADHTLFDQFASTIDINAQQDIKIINILVDHYFSVGNFRKAADILNRAQTLDVNPSIDQLQDLDVALHAVANARIQLRRSADHRPALTLIYKLEQIDVFDKELGMDLSTTTSSLTHTSDRRTINIESREETYERWIMFEQTKALLYSDLMKCGCFTAGFITTKTRSWVENAISFLQSRDDLKARRLEVGILTSFYDKSSDYNEKQTSWIRRLIASCPDGSIERTRALQLYGIHLMATSTDQATSKFEECRHQYVQTSNVVGQLVIEWLLFMISPGSVDKGAAYLNMAKRFINLGQFSGAKACVDLAEKSIHNDVDRLEKFDKLEEFAKPILNTMGDLWSVKEYELRKCSARAFAPSRDPADLHAALTMAEKLLKEQSTPAHEFSCMKVVQHCAAALQQWDKADKFDRILLNHQCSHLDYARRSALINDLSMSNYTKITAQSKMALSIEERESTYALLQDEIRRLEEYYDLDIKHQLFDLAGIKLERLILYHNTVDLAYPRYRQQAKAGKVSCYSRYRGYSNLLPSSALIEMFARLESGNQSTGVEIADHNLRRIKDLPIENPMALGESHLLCAVSRRTNLEAEKRNMSSNARSTVLIEIMQHLRQSFAYLKLANASDVFYTRATATILDTVYDALQINPEAQNDLLVEVQEFLDAVEKALVIQRKPFLGQTETQLFVQSRSFESKNQRKDFYKRVADFFYKLNHLDDWRLWHERGRSRALCSRLIQFIDDQVPVIHAQGVTPGVNTQGSKKVRKQGMPTNAMEMQQVFESIFEVIANMSSNTKVTIIDFHISMKGNISLVVIDSESKKSTVVPTSLTTTIMEQWYIGNIGDTEVRSAHDPTILRHLQPLWSAIDRFSKEDDLLVLLPVFPLSCFPLHTVVAGYQQKPLYGRNPIVYAGSIMMLNNCLENAYSAQRPAMQNNVAFMCTHENFQEQEYIFESHKEICKKVGFNDPEKNVTKSSFKHRLHRASWIHYHGNAKWFPGEPLRQSYQLAIDESTGNTELTVAEILSLDLQSRPVIISMAPNSSIQDDNQADEQLGLVSALVAAGATTILGTLGSINDAAGREFSKFFYDDIHAQITKTGGDESWINLAQACKTAVVRLGNQAVSGDKDSVILEPGDWGAFVLHGCPFFKFR